MADNTNKENLQKLLAFLKNSIINQPENAWFVDELRFIIGTPQGASTSNDKIEKYLGLDYRLDGAKTIIDYDFIEDEHIRNCFVSDCREMLRFRYGTRGHKIDFSEFCRYVIIQAERLLNIYYSSKGSFEEIKEYIKKYNERAKFSNEIKTLEAISFAVKLWAFASEFNLAKIRQTLDKVREVRNLQSHGDVTQTEENEFFFRHRQSLIDGGYPLKENGEVNWYKLSSLDQIKQNVYNNVIKKSAEHQRYINLIWKRSLPFNDVVDALETLATLIKNNQ